MGPECTLAEFMFLREAVADELAPGTTAFGHLASSHDADTLATAERLLRSGIIDIEKLLKGMK